MSATLQPICERQTQCKCCGAAALPYGVVDFNKNCEIYRHNALGISGVPIYYHRCRACGFIFTTAFDRFTHEDFRSHIYNEEYPLIDPDYQAARPQGNAALVNRLFPTIKPGRRARLRRRQWRSGRIAAAPRDFPMSRPTTRLSSVTPPVPPNASIVLSALRSSSIPPTPAAHFR